MPISHVDYEVLGWLSATWRLRRWNGRRRLMPRWAFHAQHWENTARWLWCSYFRHYLVSRLPRTHGTISRRHESYAAFLLKMFRLLSHAKIYDYLLIVYWLLLRFLWRLIKSPPLTFIKIRPLEMISRIGHDIITDGCFDILCHNAYSLASATFNA